MSGLIAETELRSLEALIHEAAKKIKELTAASNKLGAENSSLKAENGKLREELKALNAVAGRQERLKTRLTRLSRKLESL